MIRKYRYTALPEAARQVTDSQPDAVTALLAKLKEQDFDRLAAFAREQHIDLGQTTSAGGAYKKIEAHLLAEQDSGDRTQ